MSEWSNRAGKYMASIQDELFKKHPEQIKKWEKAAKSYEWPTSELKITVSEDAKYTGKFAITFKVGNAYATLIKFTLDCYPECCALGQLNGFYLSDEFLVEPFLKEFIQQCVACYRVVVVHRYRWMINFVEFSRQDIYNTKSKNIPLSDKSSIQFPMMYKWAKEYDNIETTFVNHNTGNIIHNVIVNLE